MGAVRFLAVLVSGILFGFGLAVSTMVSPEVVLSFLRFQDWGLMLVMGGAMGVTLLAYQFAPRLWNRPWLGDHFSVRPSVLDRDTVCGAAIFGVGWGICGVCPGPAIAGLGTGNADLLVALAGIALGAYLQGVWASRRKP
ncbi:MAG: DUF6691 family protein [Rhodoferax sp.]